MTIPTCRSPLAVALIVVALQGCLACQSSRAPSGSGESQTAPSSSATGRQNGRRDQPTGRGPTAKDATAEDRQNSPIGTAGEKPEAQGDYQITSGEPGSHTGGAPTEGQALSDEFIARILAPWNGDLPGIKERRYLRMLVTFNRTHYYADRLQQHG
jgi:hypothetical protein